MTGSFLALIRKIRYKTKYSNKLTSFSKAHTVDSVRHVKRRYICISFTLNVYVCSNFEVKSEAVGSMLTAEPISHSCSRFASARCLGGRDGVGSVPRRDGVGPVPRRDGGSAPHRPQFSTIDGSCLSKSMSVTFTKGFISHFHVIISKCLLSHTNLSR